LWFFQLRTVWRSAVPAWAILIHRNTALVPNSLVPDSLVPTGLVPKGPSSTRGRRFTVVAEIMGLQDTGIQVTASPVMVMAAK